MQFEYSSVPDFMKKSPFYIAKVQDMFTGYSAPKHPNLLSSKFTHKMIDYSLPNCM